MKVSINKIVILALALTAGSISLASANDWKVQPSNADDDRLNQFLEQQQECLDNLGIFLPSITGGQAQCDLSGKLDRDQDRGNYVQREERTISGSKVDKGDSVGFSHGAVYYKTRRYGGTVTLSSNARRFIATYKLIW